MAFRTSLGLQHISNIVNAVDIKESNAFNDFCIKELKQTEELIDQNIEIDHCSMPLTDKAIEETFLFLNRYISRYEKEFKENHTRCLHRCVTYLDNGEKLRIPKQLSESAILAILKCLHSLFTVIDLKSLTSFIQMLITPVTETDESKWACIDIIPSISKSKAFDYLQSDDFRTLFTILLFNLNNLISHESHEIKQEALTCTLLLVITSGKTHVVPVLPSILSNLVIQSRVDSLMSWRERVLILLLFGTCLSLLPAKENKKKVNEESISNIISDWLQQCRLEAKEVDNVEVVAETAQTQAKKEQTTPIQREENENLASFQGRKVLTELKEQVPPLLTNLIQISLSISHTNVTLAILHCSHLVIPSSIHYFNSMVMLCCDTIISFLTSSYSIIASTASVLLSHILNQKQLQTQLIQHISHLLMELPSTLCVQSETKGLSAINTLHGYFTYLSLPLKTLLTTESDSFSTLHSFYDQLKQCLQIDSINTIGIQVVKEDKQASCFVIHYHYLTEQEASSLFSTLKLVFQLDKEMESELLYWLLNDCLDGKEEAMLLCPALLYHHNTLTPSIEDFISTLLDSIHHHVSSTSPLLIYSLLCIIIQTNAIQQYSSQLLFILFYYKSLHVHEGLISDALIKLMYCLHYKSIEEMAFQNCDYLIDSILIQLKIAAAVKSPFLQEQLLFLSSVWTDIVGDFHLNNPYFPYIRDSIQLCLSLLQSYPSHVIQVLVPISRFLVLSSSIKQPKIVKSVVDMFCEQFQNDEEVEKTTEASEANEASEATETTEANEATETTETTEATETAEAIEATEAAEATETTETTEATEQSNLLEQICIQIKFYTSSSDKTIQNAIFTIIHTVLELASKDKKIALLTPYLPFLEHVLSEPNSSLFISALDCTLSICCIDSFGSSSRMTTSIWPLIKLALEGCINSNQNDYAIVQSKEKSISVYEGIMKCMIKHYTNYELFKDCVNDIVDLLEEQPWNALANSLLNQICRYNLTYSAWTLETKHINIDEKRKRDHFIYEQYMCLL